MAVATEVIARRYQNIVADEPINVDFPLYRDNEVLVVYGKNSLEAVPNVDFNIVLNEDFDTFDLTPTQSLIDKINNLILIDNSEQNYIVVRLDMEFLTSSTPDAVINTEFTSREFDRTARRFQQVDDVVKRSVRLPNKDIDNTNSLLIKEVVEGRVLAWGENGEIVAAPMSEAEIAADVSAASEARDEAVAARILSETARDEAQTAQSGSEAAEVGSEAAKTSSETAKNAAVAAQTGAEAARDAAIAGAADVYADTTAGLAGTSNGDYFIVPVNDEVEAYKLYENVSGVATERASVPSTAFLQSLLGPGKNKFDKTTARSGRYYSPGSDAIIGSSAFRCTDFILLEEGQKYTVSGAEPGMLYVFADAASDTANFTGNTTISSGSGTFTVPTGSPYLVVNITNNGSTDTTYDDTLQIEEGVNATTYEAYKQVIKREKLPGDGNLVGRDEILSLVSFNAIDPDNIDYVSRYSTGGLGFVSDTLGIAASDWIEVEEGEFYTLAGDGVYVGFQGGYFTGDGELNAHSNITFINPPSGGGKSFQVPTGQGITHVVVSLRKLNDSPSATSLHGNAQLEKGEVATNYQAYDPEEQIKSSLLPESSGTQQVAATISDASWYQYVEADEGSPLIDKLPRTRETWLSRDKDLVVVNTGTSLTARSTEHCTNHPQAAFRPPLMHSNNFASLLWDRLKWDGQQYRRYDVPAEFTETGTFTTSHDESEWDDNSYRNGLTRHSNDTNAAVEFDIPIDAWQFNFIYRTDSTGCDAQISISEGSNQVEVWNGTSWVEANNYSFSMNEPAPVNRNISVPSPATGDFTVLSIASKGNTTYQKRLKMRCRNSSGLDSRSSSKTVTISRTGGGARFMYWGTEWSPREFMVTYINAARGSHNTQATSANGLPRYQDNEIWDFEPDLLLFELPIHNDGAAAAGVYAANYWENLTNNFVFRSDYELSLKTRGAHFNSNPEIAMFTASIAWNFGGIESDGTLKYSLQQGGKLMSALDKYQEAYLWVKENQPTAVCINAAKRWVDAGNAIHGDLRTATLGSGKNGNTFTNEGSHWNDTGSKVMAKAVLPLLNFVL